MATLAGKDALLHWCQERTAPYRRCGISVQNFSTSFQDGRAFVALVHSQWPSSIAHPETLSAEDAQANLNLAFGVAERFGVFKLLDADLIAASGHPEPKTVMTYLAELRKQIRKDGSEETQSPLRSKSMPAMRVGAVSASDDVASLLADVDLSTLKRPSRPRAQTTAAPAKSRAKTGGPPPIPNKAGGGAGPPAIPKKKKKAVIPGRVTAGAQVAGMAVDTVQQSTTGVTVAFMDTGGGSSGIRGGKSFGDMRTHELKAECRKRGLPDSGDRDEMVAHLELHTDEAEDV